MTKLSSILWTIILIVVMVLSTTYLFQIFIILLLPVRVSITQQLSLYGWLVLGMALYSIFQRFFHKNIKFLETVSHEWSHTIVALLTFRRVHSFHAEEGTGMVYTSGPETFSHIPLSLAPYCLPVVTYLLLAIRCLVSIYSLWIFDILVGITLCFYLYCFKHQTGSYQTDINRYPLHVSYLFIWTCRIINTAIILVSFFPNYNVFTSFWRFISTTFDYLVLSINWLIGLFSVEEISLTFG